MEIVYIIYIVTILLLSLAITLKRHTRTKSDFLTTAYIHQISEQLNRQSSQRLLAHNQTEQQALLEALYYVMAHSYGVDLRVICKIIYDNRLDRYIEHKISHSADPIDRARLLSLLNYLPHNYDSTKFHHLLNASDTALRRGALLATLACNPSMAISTIIKLRYTLSTIDIAHIVSLLRRNLIPIACEPLLKSSNRNLILLGMAIVRNFGISMAESELHAIITCSSDQTIVREAIYTLCSIHATLRGEWLQRRLSTINPSSRKILCRQLSIEGYSIETIRQVVPTQEIELAERIICSHKRRLKESIATQ